MLQAMREHASSWIIKVLLGIIVVVFVFFGVGSYRSQKGNYVAIVNGQQISKEEFRNVYNNLIQQMRQRFGNNLSEDMIKMLQVKKQAMDRLIGQTVILQEAESLNIKVTNDELKDAIRSMTVFQKNGVFDSATYQTLLNRIQMSPEKFEDDQKRQILTNKLSTLVLNSIKVSEFEAKKWYEWENVQVNINMAQFDPKSINDIEPKEEEITEYFEKNKSKYKTEPTVKVRYLKFSPDSYKSKINLTEDEVKEYYDDNTEKFANPKTVEARHILIKVDQSAPEELVTEAKNKAQDILQKTKNKDQDFSELAKKYSEGPSKTKGGYLGEFKKEAMVKPFSDKAFSMKAGEISDLVRTNFGWHIIKVEKVNEAHTLTLAEAGPEIRQTLMTEKTSNLAYDEAVAVFETSIDGDDLVETAKEREIELLTTDFFTRQKGPKATIQDRSKFISTAFDLPKMDISDILELKNEYYILQVIEKTPQKISDLADVKEKVTQDLLNEIKDKKASEKAEEFLTALKNGSQMETESEKLNIEMKTTDFFKRNDSIPIIGRDQNISNAAFMLHEENRLPEKVLKARSLYYVIEFKERKAPEPEGFEKEKKSIIDKIKRQKSAKAFELWLSQIKGKSDITIEKEFL